MVRNKLSDHDQTTLVRLYRKSTLTATVLAEYYTVSPSTITRLLKEAIPEREYQELVSQKRSLARRKDVPELGVEHVDEILQILDEEEQAKAEATLESESEIPEEEEISAPQTADLNGQTQPTAVTTTDSWISEVETEDLEAEEDEDEENPEDEDEDGDEDQDWDDSDVGFDPEVLHDLEEEIDHFPQGEEDDDEDEGDEEYDEDDEDEDLEDNEDEGSRDGQEYSYEQSFEILPLEELEPPHLCFVVVDRFDELTTRPLRDFMPIDVEEVTQEGLSVEMAAQAKTLPIFDNQRVARRFSQMSRRGSHPSQRNRVIQFPGYLLDVVRSQLQSKGITHLLVDGQVYSL